MEQINVYLGVVVSIITIGSALGGIISYRKKRGITKRMALLTKQLLFISLILRVLSEGSRMQLQDLKDKVVRKAGENPAHRPYDMTEEEVKKWATNSFFAALEIVKQEGIGLVKTDFEIHFLSPLGKDLVKLMAKV